MNSKHKYTFCLCLLSLLLILPSCSHDTAVRRKDDGGKHLFSLLKNFNPADKQQFESEFVSLETIHRIGNDRKLFRTKKRRDRYAKMTREEYENQIIDHAYNIISREGDAFDIHWEDIKYVDFHYKDEKYSNLETIKAQLVFEYKEKNYDVGCIFVKYDNEWHLAGIGGLFMQGVNNPKRQKNPYLFDI